MFGGRLLQVNTKNMYSNAAQLCSLTISKNAPSKEHAICMQAFLHAAEPLATINEKPNEGNTFKASKSAHYKVPKPVFGKCLVIPMGVAKSITSHTDTCVLLHSGTNNRFMVAPVLLERLSSSSRPAEPRSCGSSRVKHSKFQQAAVGQKDSSPNS